MSYVVEYYRRRDGDYEEIHEWRDPHRQEEQGRIGEAIKESLRERRVLEVACGTGYWTRILSKSARSIIATDLVDEVMELAKTKRYICPVTFRREDAYDLSFDGGLAFSWLSHVPRRRVDPFLREFHRVMEAGSHRSAQDANSRRT